MVEEVTEGSADVVVEADGAVETEAAVEEVEV